MKPWHGLGLSLLVALSLHTVILLVPRLAGRADVRVQAVELSLVSLPAEEGFDDTRNPPVRKGGARPIAPPAVRGASPSANPAPPLTSAESPWEPSPEATAELPASQDPPTAPDSLLSTRAPDSSVAVGGPGAVTGSIPASASRGSEMDAITPPRARAEILPTYPRSARKAGLEGFVRIAAFINESGIVVGAEILSSSGHAVLDQAALQEVRRSVFEPARQAGRSVPFRLIIPFRFRLN